MGLGLEKQRNKKYGFSLVELSIVVAIMSVVAVLGLEVAGGFLGNRAYNETLDKVNMLDRAVQQYYHVNGRLPCPASRTVGLYDANVGTENCIALPGTSGANLLYGGMVPFRALNLPISVAIDSYGNRINYVVTASLTNANTFYNGIPQIEIDSGQLTNSCGTATNCEKLADPTSSATPGAAYIIFSNGPDGKGGITRKGGATSTACAAGTGIDAQNCIAFINGSVMGILSTVFYDSRYNSGTQSVNFFDDIVAWRPKSQL